MARPTAKWPRGALTATVIAILAVGCASPATSIAPSLSTVPTATGVASPSASASSSVPLGPLPTNALGDAKAASLQGVLDAYVERGAPDMVAAVITDDGIWAGAAGIAVASVGTLLASAAQPALANDEFAIASITKMFTATLIMRLAEQGKIDLDAPLASYLGDLQVDTNKATVRQALGMQAGLAATDPGIYSDFDPGRAWTSAEIVATFLAPVSTAGTSYLYSNPTYELLAFAAERVTGKSYASALRAELLDRFGFDRIVQQGPEAVTPQPWALPLASHTGGLDPAIFGQGGAMPSLGFATFSVGAASMASDAPSLAAWAWLLCAGQIVTPLSLSEMTPAGNDQYGLGLHRVDFGTTRGIGHAGDVLGYGAMVACFPERHIVIAVLDNDSEVAVDLVVRDLLLAASAP